MNMRMLLLPVGLLALLGCSSSSSIAVPTTDPETLKGTPAGVSTFAFMDLTATLPGLLTGTYPAHVTLTPVSATSANLVLSGYPSATGGTLAGTIGLATTTVPAGTNLVETFDGLVTTRSSTLTWTYTGALNVTVRGGDANVLTEPTGLQVAVSDPATPANTKIWTFVCGLDLATPTGGGLSLAGTFTLSSGTTDSVGAAIDPATPLVWQPGGLYPSSGTLTLTDNRPGIVNRETITAIFGKGQVNLNGGNLPLGK